MQLLDGKKLSLSIQEDLKHETKKLKETGITPGLAVLLVGDDEASQRELRRIQEIRSLLNR